MQLYLVKPGESFSDVVLNATGNISNWSQILDANSFTDWVPSLSPGQSIIIPESVIINRTVLLNLKSCCNNQRTINVSSITSQFVQTVTYSKAIIIDTAKKENTYTVKPGETIGDICYNSTGTIKNLELIINANGFTSWVPDLTPGQKLIIPDTVEIQTNVLFQLSKNPTSNKPNICNLNEQISILIEKFAKTASYVFSPDLTDFLIDEETPYIFNN